MEQICIYLLPLVFMLHELEEIMMMPHWLPRHEEQLIRRFPPARRMLRSLAKLPAPAFTLAVSEEFVILSACTVIALTTRCLTPWYCCLIAFGIHLFVHLIQFLMIRKYIPTIVTTFLCLPYCIWAFVQAQPCYTPGETLLWGITGCAGCVANLLLIHRFAPKLWYKIRGN